MIQGRSNALVAMYNLIATVPKTSTTCNSACTTVSKRHANIVSQGIRLKTVFRRPIPGDQRSSLTIAYMPLSQCPACRRQFGDDAALQRHHAACELYKHYQDALLQRALQGRLRGLKSRRDVDQAHTTVGLRSPVTTVSSSSTALLPAVADEPSLATLPKDLEVNQARMEDESSPPDVATHTQAELDISPMNQDAVTSSPST